LCRTVNGAIHTHSRRIAVEQGLAVPAAAERAVQALWTWNRADESPVCRENVQRRAGRDVDTPLLIDRRSIAAGSALELSELALVCQRSVNVHVKRVHDRAVGDVQRLLVGAEDMPDILLGHEGGQSIYVGIPSIER
jgi:hypothetical protein